MRLTAVGWETVLEALDQLVRYHLSLGKDGAQVGKREHGIEQFALFLMLLACMLPASMSFTYQTACRPTHPVSI